MQKVLVLSNAGERGVLQDAFQSLGFEVTRPGEQADLIVANACDVDGARLSNVVRLHETKGKVPLLLTIDPDSDKSPASIPAMEMADDFIFMPLNPVELSLRLNALLKRSRTIDEAPMSLACGDLVANRDSLSVKVADQARALSVLEFKLLWFLMLNAEKVVSRPTILQNVWRGTVVSNRTIDAHIVGLRRALQGMSYRIETIYGAGYSLRSSENTTV